MAKRLPSDVYAALIKQGFAADQATVMTAIAGAESGFDDAALGDQQLQSTTWGPSFGIFQIRTVKADTGRGTARDISNLAGSLDEQAEAAWQISGHGRDFSPWSVFTSGRYQQFLGQAQSAAGDFPTAGPGWAPWNWPSNVANAAVAEGLGGARSLVVTGLFVVLGLGLVAAGAYAVARPAWKSNTARAYRAAGLR
jgi:hypothetical protein